MFGLTSLGVVHTAISLVAVGAGIASFWRYRAILAHTTLGRWYIWATILTCLTGFGIFQHGGFGKPHALGVITLLVLAIATLADRRRFGKASAYVRTIAYSLTFFFHMIPGFTETLTRLPAGSPTFSSPDDPALAKLISVVFGIFIVGVALQIRRLRASGGAAVDEIGMRPT